MKYRCNKCDIIFSLEEEAKVRCPKCMGIHSVDQVSEETQKKDKKSVVVQTTIGFALLAIAGFFLWKNSINANDQTDGADVGDILDKLTGIVDHPENPLETDDSVTNYCAAATDGKDKLEGIYQGLKANWQKKGLSALDATQATAQWPKTLKGLVSALNNKKTIRASSYEQALLLWGCARAAGLENATMVEIFSFKNEKSPADPTALFGRYGVIADKSDPEGSDFVDPFGQRQGKGAMASLRVLDEATAAAPYFAHISLAEFTKADLKKALKYNDAAIALDPESPTLLMHRGKIFMASGSVQDATVEFEKAKKLKDWPPTKVALAQISLISGANTNEVEADIRDALKTFPEYTQAMALLASVYLSRGESQSAEQELQRATALAPGSVDVATVYAQMYLMQNDVENAIQYAQKAVRLSKEGFQQLMVLAQVYQATARFDEARDAAKRAAEKAPSEKIRQQLAQTFGFSQTEEEESATEDETGSDTANIAGDSDTPLAPPVSPGSLKLKLGNGDPAAGRDGPTLGGDRNQLKLHMNAQ